MHRVDMTAGSFKFAINDFLKALFTTPPAPEVENTLKHFTTDTCLGGQCGGLKRGGKLGSDQGLQTGLYRLTIPLPWFPRGGLRPRPPLTQDGRAP